MSQQAAAVTGSSIDSRPPQDAASQHHCPDGCPHCKTPLRGGLKFEAVCVTCEPVYLQRCGGCQRQLWNCMCVRPHTWE